MLQHKSSHPKQSARPPIPKGSLVHWNWDECPYGICLGRPKMAPVAQYEYFIKCYDVLLSDGVHCIHEDHLKVVIPGSIEREKDS